MSSQILKDLSSLGCNFAISEDSISADPEQTVIRTIDYFWQDKKIFTMLIGLIKFRLFHLINVQRLLILSKNLDSERKAILAVLSLKIFRHTQDERYQMMYNLFKKDNLKLTRIPQNYQDPFYISRRGTDKEFKKIKIEVADFFNDQHSKKFNTLERILAKNSWLKYRALIGPSFRADIIFLFIEKKMRSQSDICKLVGCNKSTVSRLWRSIQELQHFSLTL